ncbi:MAG: CRISPR-associated endonuclease Cas2 [Nitrosomonas sp.]|uniref:CRISPR-associated endonuclease Cas2 n=1 Tax=Nitrosomonas aestuarii TaxID=52441 RepID=A0A1I4CV79_9PROT|nr:CRISPR-associated endonuclease Cas2 [Nitrosomonas sp.]SFK85188.1 CRISPR-associated endonuclease Cas2 [Nitrosomonas aestuarii]
MADNQSNLYLIAYDIADSKRLARVHRVLKQQGLPVQFSVFMVVLNWFLPDALHNESINHYMNHYATSLHHFLHKSCQHHACLNLQ